MATEALAPTTAASDIPQLWVLSIVRAGKAPDIAAVYRAMGVPSQRAVVISEFPLHLPSGISENGVVLGADRDADLWNAGLEYIRHKQDPRPGTLWDVLLFDPAAPLSMMAVHSLRHHMRMLDVWMAEPDIFGALGFRTYQTLFDAEPNELHPEAIVVAGEMGMRFDRRYYDASDAWVEYCRRTRSRGGSVLVSSTGMAEIS